jgi:hypothetical protein
MEEAKITTPNIFQSFHIGFNDYLEARTKVIRDLMYSTTETKKLREFFKTTLGWQRNSFSADDGTTPKLIEEKIQKMLDNTTGLDFNPYVVNVITFCGHGITIGGDSYALIPSIKYSDTSEEITSLYPLNVSKWAYLFAQKKSSVNIFLFSGSREQLDKKTENFEELFREICKSLD